MILMVGPKRAILTPLDWSIRLHSNGALSPKVASAIALSLDGQQKPGGTAHYRLSEASFIDLIRNQFLQPKNIVLFLAFDIVPELKDL